MRDNWSMKIIDKEEREAHSTYIALQGLKGGLYGLVFSGIGFLLVRTTMPQRFATFNHSIKSCMFVMPSISIAAYWADQGSVEFDKKMYQSPELKELVLADFREWKNSGIVSKIQQFVRG